MSSLPVSVVPYSAVTSGYYLPVASGKETSGTRLALDRIGARRAGREASVASGPRPRPLLVHDQDPGPERDGDRVRAVPRGELAQDALHVGAHGLHGHVQPVGDRLVLQPVRDQLEDLELAPGQ